jgi:hypothetical protein
MLVVLPVNKRSVSLTCSVAPPVMFSVPVPPAEGTEEIVRVLESVLRRNPSHVGANHYYVHAVEASPTPERALPSAWSRACAR